VSFGNGNGNGNGNEAAGLASATVFCPLSHLCEHADDAVKQAKRLVKERAVCLLVPLNDEDLRRSLQSGATRDA
jgi:hypothetical protein